MSDIKVLKVNAQGHYQEHDEAADSIKVSSLKTANNELTDAKLGALISGGDASTQHDHASIYFGKTEFIDASAGVADAGKPIVANADGLVDATFLPSLAHDDLDGVANSTAHLAFPLLVGGRDFSAIQKYDNVKSFTAPESLVDKNYVDNVLAAALAADNWLTSIYAAALDPSSLGTITTGMRVLVQGNTVASGDYTGHENDIATYNGATWDFQSFASIPDGSTVRVIGSDIFYMKNTIAWSMHQMEATQVEADGPLFFSAINELDLAIKATSGLKIVAQELAADMDTIVDGVTIINNLDRAEINFSTTFNDMLALAAQDLNASITPFSDANFTATFVDTALVELYNKVEDGAFPKYTSGSAITKGDVVYISAAGIVSIYSTLSNNDEVVGIALETVADASPVKVAHLDFVLTGVLSSAVAGTRYYWDGSAFSTSMSVASGANVWTVGVAKNATDLIIKVAHIRKNA